MMPFVLPQSSIAAARKFSVVCRCATGRRSRETRPFVPLWTHKTLIQVSGCSPCSFCVIQLWIEVSLIERQNFHYVRFRAYRHTTAGRDHDDDVFYSCLLL